MSDMQEYTDVVSITPSQYNSATVRGSLMEGRIETFDHDTDAGVVVFQDGGWLALSSGTIDDSAETNVHTHHELTPEQAREIAAGLEEAANEAEEALEEAESVENSGRGIVDRLVAATLGGDDA